MKGLEIARSYYLQYGKPMLAALFSDVQNRIAVGLAGEGSECLGFDDAISHDHDFDVGFCLWLTREDADAFGFRLERAYAKLPREFMGLCRSYVSPVGGSRRGVMTIDGFYTRFLGAPSAPDTIERWLYTPSHALLSASNGAVFEDSLGVFSSVRAALQKGYPEDIRRKKLSAHLLFMAQSGQYNYERCLCRGESGAAQLAVFEFVKHAISAIYLLNNRYEPFYKWVYRGLGALPILGHIGDALSALTELDNTSENRATKKDVISDTVALVIDACKRQALSGKESDDLEVHAYAVLDGVHDGVLRNMHIMEGI